MSPEAKVTFYAQAVKQQQAVGVKKFFG